MIAISDQTAAHIAHDHIAGNATLRDQLALGERMQRALAAAPELERLSGTEAIAFVQARTYRTQAEIARLSGMTPATICALKKGKKPNAAQRAALLWALARAG